MNAIVATFLIVVLKLTISTTSVVPLDPSIKRFQEYLQIPSVQPNVNYDPCIKFIRNQAKELNLPITIYELRPGKPIAVITWKGTRPELPSFLISSHMDVVAVDEDNWDYPPFDAEIANGNIYARGTQDMKSVGIQYLEAIRKLQADGTTLKRTLHIIFTPDEETGGDEGMKLFVHTKEFKALNVGFALDEGLACPDESFLVFNGERIVSHLTITCHGTSGHGSLFIENTAAEKLNHMINKLLQFRSEQQTLLENNSSLNIGDVTTVNWVKAEGGVANNIVPGELKAVFDVRLAPTLGVVKFEEMLAGWGKEAGSDVIVDLANKTGSIPVTNLDGSNPWWVGFKSAADELGIELDIQIMAGSTDGAYIRLLGIPLISFSPMNKTPQLLHANNEFVGVDTFLRGIEIYKNIIKSLGNISDN